MEHSRPLIKTDINRASRLLFYFFIYANITIQQDNFKHIELFFNKIPIISQIPCQFVTYPPPERPHKAGSNSSRSGKVYHLPDFWRCHSGHRYLPSASFPGADLNNPRCR